LRGRIQHLRRLLGILGGEEKSGLKNKIGSHPERIIGLTVSVNDISCPESLLTAYTEPEVYYG
ncbi:MAG: hypothetical protein OXN84_15815, partial [Albidovulum sp.]|nr:hypothetical protein [Albidovulum sp.]